MSKILLVRMLQSWTLVQMMLLLALLFVHVKILSWLKDELGAQGGAPQLPSVGFLGSD